MLIALDVILIVITVGQYILPCIMLDKFVIYYASSFAFNQGPLCAFTVSPEEESFYHLSITKSLISFLMFFLIMPLVMLDNWTI